MVFGLAVTVLLLAGVILGIVAMVLARQGQRVSIMARSSIGLLLMGLLAAIAVPNFVRARSQAQQSKQALRELNNAAASMRAQTAAWLTNGESPRVDPQRLQRSLSEAVAKSSGDTAVLLKVSQLYLQRVQSCEQAYTRAANELTEAKVLAAANLERRAQIEERRAVVQKFLAANEAFKTIVQQSESYYRKELAAAGISPAQAEAALKGFRKNSTAQIPLLVSIREADDRLGQAFLGVLNLYDTQWGQWSYDPNARLVRFQDRTALGQYNTLMTEIKQAGTDQAAAQKQLASVLSQSATAL